MGPKLAAKLPIERERRFKDYLRNSVQESLVLSQTTPAEIEALCLALEPGKGQDGMESLPG